MLEFSTSLLSYPFLQTSSGGSPSSAVVLDFNPGEGDTKSNNCKYVFTVGGAQAVP